MKTKRIDIIDYIRPMIAQMKTRKHIENLCKLQFPDVKPKEISNAYDEVKESLSVNPQDVFLSSVAAYQDSIGHLDYGILSILSNGDYMDVNGLARLIETKRKIILDAQQLTGQIISDEKDPEIIVDDAWREED
jgi:hypothetical protein